MQNLCRALVNDKDGRPVLWQRPNLVLIIWFASGVIARFARTSPWHGIFAGISTVALVVWAVLEVLWGASYFRRALGVVVFTYIIISRLFG